MEQDILFALFLSFLVGVAAIVGGFLSFFVKRDNMKHLSICMGFSAGMMIFLVFMELLPEAIEKLSGVYPLSQARWLAMTAFFGGIFLGGVADHLIPEHHIEDSEIPCGDKPYINRYKIERTGIFATIAVAIHNIPAGLVTFMGGLESAVLGISVAVAIGLHSIPEGVAVALPIYNATGNKKKTLLYTGLSGMATPLGALIGLLFLSSIDSGIMLGGMFALAAGIMAYLAFDELMPTANKYGDGHKEILGIIAGMFIMAVSFLLTH